ncbi:MAG: hypothetical protein ACSHYA_03950 [Opitutaceae bacterium]
MGNTTPHILTLLTLIVVGCTTTAPTEYYRPASAAETVYRIGGEYDPNIGWAGAVTITINDESVIREKLPAFSNTAELSGEYAGKPVRVQFTKVRNFKSKYLRADVTIDKEQAVSLTF